MYRGVPLNTIRFSRQGDFRYQFGRSGTGFLIIPDTLSMTGSLDRPGWWLPFPCYLSLCLFVFPSLFISTSGRYNVRFALSRNVLKNLIGLHPFGVTGKGSPPTGPVHSRLSRW